jgi:6-hydroxycyclohex-1-ene-1-carbonyl-CoA dehydrogenase
MKIDCYEMRTPREPLVRSTRELPAPSEGQAIVEVAGCGVCHTDIGFLYEGVPTRKAPPIVLGHEISGVVVAAGPGATDWLGKNVIVPAVIPCGNCYLCRKGRGDICKTQIFPGCDVDGGFATHVCVPARGLCPVPASIAPNPAALASLSVVADALSTAWQAVQKSNIIENDFAVVIGVGGVGGFAAQCARARGAQVLAIDVDAARLEPMREFGVTHAVNAREPGIDVRRRVRDIAKAHNVPQTEWKIFETSGTPAGQSTAFSLLCPGAYLGIVGFHPGDVTVRLSNLMALAARAEGTWGCLPEHYPAVLKLVEEKKVAIEPFIEMFPMSEIQSVLEGLRRHELHKRPVLLPNRYLPRP